MKLTIFYDGQCPLCMAEMRQLKKHDASAQLVLVDLHDADLAANYPHIHKPNAMRMLHAQLENGAMLYGLDVTCKAWSIVGRHRWLAILRWPLIRTLADRVYLLFARYRGQLAYLLTGKSHCDSCLLAETESACQTSNRHERE